MIWSIFFMSLAYAAGEKGRSILKEEPAPILEAQDVTPGKPVKGRVPAKVGRTSNLPPEYRRGLPHFDSSERVVYVSKLDSTLRGIRAGTILRAAIDQELVVSQNVPNPVRAVVISENLKGAYLVGEATLDKDLKRALVSFSKIQLRAAGEVYSFKGQTLDLSGSVGLVGTYHNQSARFLVGEFASAAAAGFLDAGISRNQTIQGGYVTEPSLANAGKAGAVAALSKSTERFAEASRSASDFTKIVGFREIQIIVQDDPTLQK